MSVYLIFIPFQPDSEREDDLVGADYIAQRTGLAESSIIAGRAGIKEIPRVRRKPAAWRRGDVDEWLSQRAQAAQTPKQRALKLLDRSKPRKKNANAA
jgi:predicted DNA-binding transcriptional regulator AlpA